MSVSYDVFCAAFLEKISEYELLKLDESTRTDIVDGYMKRAITAFKKICEYDLTTTSDDTLRVFNTDIADEDIDEIVLSCSRIDLFTHFCSPSTSCL